MVETRSQILGQDRVNEALAQFLFHAREQHHSTIEYHPPPRINVGVVETLQEPRPLALPVLHRDEALDRGK